MIIIMNCKSAGERRVYLSTIVAHLAEVILFIRHPLGSLNKVSMAPLLPVPFPGEHHLATNQHLNEMALAL